MTRLLPIAVLAAALCFRLAHAAGTETTAPETPTARESMAQGKAAVAKKDWQAAIAAYKAAVDDEPANPDAHNMLAYSFRKQATPNLDKAFEHYRIALKLNPKHLGAHEYIGEAYLMAGKPQDAKTHLAHLEKLCGKKCEEYQDLARAIAGHSAKVGAQANAKY